MRTQFLITMLVSVVAFPASAQETAESSAKEFRADSATTSDILGKTVRPRRRGDLITEADVRAAINASDALTLVQRLRPHWLRQPRRVEADPRTMEFLLVRYNNREIGPYATLRDINTSNVVSIRFYSPIEARTLFGPTYGAGAIVVSGR